MANKKKTNDTEKMVSINDIDKIIKSKEQSPTIYSYDIDGEIINISIKQSLSFKEKCSLVKYVTEDVFLDDIKRDYNEDTGELISEKKVGVIYAPFVKDLSFNRYLLNFYTNIKVDTSEEKIYKLIIDTDIVDIVKQRINFSQYHKIMKNINEGIEYRKQQIFANKPTALDLFFNSLTEITNEFKNTFGSDSGSSIFQNILKVLPNLTGENGKELIKEIVEEEIKTKNNIIKLPDTEKIE